METTTTKFIPGNKYGNLTITHRSRCYVYTTDGNKLLATVVSGVEMVSHDGYTVTWAR